jgi:hypothetical protein
MLLKLKTTLSKSLLFTAQAIMGVFGMEAGAALGAFLANAQGELLLHGQATIAESSIEKDKWNNF